MKLKQGFLLGLVFCGAALDCMGQGVYFNVSRQKWVMQTGVNAVPFAHRFSAAVLGNGLVQAYSRSPVVSNALTGGSYQMTFATNVVAVSVNETNIVFDTNTFQSLYPTGQYTLKVNYKVSVINGSQTFQSDLMNDFSAVDPIITNVTPLSALSRVQTFSWPIFSTATEDYCRFFLIEGSNLSTNLMQSLLNNGIETITNGNTVLYWGLNLAPTANSITVSNLNPLLNHLAVLEYHRINPVSGDVTVPHEVSSVSACATFFVGLSIVTQPQSQVVEEGDVAMFNVIAVGATPLTYQWYYQDQPIPNQTNLVFVIPYVQKTDAGPYYVRVTNPVGYTNSQVATLTVTNPTGNGPLRLQDPFWGISSNVFRFTVIGQDGGTYDILASENLNAWTKIGTVTTPAGFAVFTDPGSGTNRARFYRAKKP